VFPALDPDRAPATLSAPILRGLLRERWGFPGLIISDSLAMRAITDHYGAGDAAVASVQAGCDLLLALGPDGWQDEVLDRLAVAIEEGRIPSGRLAAIADRLAREGRRWGVGAPLPTDALRLVGSAEHVEIARRIAESAITVVRDRARAVPVAGARVGIVEAGADSGDHRVPSLAPWLRRYHAGVRSVSSDSDGDSLDRVIAVTCSRGTPPSEEAHAIRHLHRRFGDRLIVVATGDPYDLLQFPDVPAYVLAYGADDLSLDATARVLAGVTLPRGRLPVALPGLHGRGEGIAP
jgi:beta-N-acetylhexosaminidase